MKILAIIKKSCNFLSPSFIYLSRSLDYNVRSQPHRNQTMITYNHVRIKNRFSSSIIE